MYIKPVLKIARYYYYYCTLLICHTSSKVLVEAIPVNNSITHLVRTFEVHEIVILLACVPGCPNILCMIDRAYP